MEQTFTYQEETVIVLTDWCFPCVKRSDNSPALMTVLRGVGTVQSTMCFVCPDTPSMESVKKKHRERERDHTFMRVLASNILNDQNQSECVRTPGE